MNLYDLLVHLTKLKSGNLSCNLFMCIILIFFSFSISLLTICAIPSLEYILSIRPLHVSSRQWNAILLIVGVKFSFMNIPCDFSRPIDVL